MAGGQPVDVHGRAVGWRWSCVRIFLVILVFLNRATAYIDCGQTDLRASRGEIRSPNYPDPYPDGTACKWYIVLANSEIATLRFVDLDIKRVGNCLRDSLVISPKREEYCGSSLPPPFTSEAGATKVLITFTSGTNTQGRKGFKIEYVVGEREAASCRGDTEFHCGSGNCIPLAWQCNGVRECNDGSDEHCQVPTVGYTSAPLKCSSHYFLCRPVDAHKPACLPESMKCDGHVDCTDHEDENECTCEHILKETHGYFKSPNFPNNYDANVDCTWHLSVADGNIIQLRFDVFDLEQDYNTDYVTVFDGDDDLSEIGVYYGYAKDGKKNINMPPSVIEGTGNHLKVVFHTDSSSSSKGFNATYQTRGVCLANQKQCSRVDLNCYGAKEECDNILACIKGQDELGCSDACRKDEIPCFSSSKGCFTMDERCDGKRNCINGEDEKKCDASVCSYKYGLFRCYDGTCMEERYICDNSDDCLHGEDEEPEICPVSTNVVTAAAIGSIVCGLLLVAALSCTCKLYQLHVRERLPPSHMSPLRQIEEELLRREAPPSYTATMASPHFDEAQRAFIEGIQAAVIARNESRTPSRSNSGGRRQRGTFVRMLSRDSIQNVSHQDENSPESQSETLPSSPAEGGETDLVSTPPQEEVPSGDSGPPRLLPLSASAPVVLPSPVEAYLESAGGHRQESASSSVSDTDSETNRDALQLEARDQQILRAAANIRRMRLAGGLQNVMQAQDHRAARARSRTGSLVDQAATDSAPEEDSGEPTSEGSPESESLNGNTSDSSARTGSADRGLPSDVLPVVASQTETSPQGSASHREAEPKLDPPQEASGSVASPGKVQPPSRSASGEGNESEAEEAEGDRDLNEERSSRASSLLSLVSTSSQLSGDDVAILSV